jgi:hypothetical protein
MWRVTTVISTLLREENPVDYKPTHEQEVVAASASPLGAKFVPVQLVVQQVQIRGGLDCLAMFDNSSQATLVLNSYAKEAKMKKVGDSCIRVKGIGSGALEPNHVYEEPMVKLNGGVVRVRAHGVDHVLGDLPKLDFSPAKQAFVSIPEKEIEVPHGLVKLLIGLDHMYLHPVEVERTGSLALHYVWDQGRVDHFWKPGRSGKKYRVDRNCASASLCTPGFFVSRSARYRTLEEVLSLHEVQGVPIQSQCAHIQRECGI